VFLRAFAVAACLGFAVGALLLIASDFDLLPAIFATTFSAGPAICAAAVGAAVVAHSGANAQPRWSRKQWIRRGAVWGAVAGGISLAAWVATFNWPDGVLMAELSTLFIIGFAAGGAVGGLVASYCFWLQHKSLAV
jgi:hypothetical protein